MTTTTTITPISATRRLLSISAAAATIAAVGLVALSAPAYAADADSMVWVCKYVGTPGVDEVLSPGENPIRVSGNSADEDMDGQVFVGDQFADAQGRSVVVQIEGPDPGADICASPLSPTTSPTPLRPPLRRLSDRLRPPVRRGGRRRAPPHRLRVARAATFPSAWSGAVSCSSGPPSWRPRRSGVAGLPPIGDVDARGRPAAGPPRAAGPDRPSGPPRVRNAPK